MSTTLAIILLLGLFLVQTVFAIILYFRTEKLKSKYLASRATIKNIDSYLNRVHPEEIKSTKALMVINKEIIGYFKLHGDKK